MRQKLDLYLPKEGKNLPLIINIHGGAWRAGSKDMGAPLDYLGRGYAVASINYRLAAVAPLPAGQLDGARAVRTGAVGRVEQDADVDGEAHEARLRDRSDASDASSAACTASLSARSTRASIGREVHENPGAAGS